ARWRANSQYPAASPSIRQSRPGVCSTQDCTTTAAVMRAVSAPARMHGNHGNLAKRMNIGLPELRKKRRMVRPLPQEGQYQRSSVANNYCKTIYGVRFSCQTHSQLWEFDLACSQPNCSAE